MQINLERIVQFFSPRRREGLVILVVSMALFIITGWASTPGSDETKGSASPDAVGGIASYYGKEHHGKKTANGEIFDMYKLTAAHRSLPFGSQVRVTNLANNRFVIVRINDRGPYIQGRIIDLSQAAAERLDMIEVGIVRVKLEVLDAKGSPKREMSPPSETPRKVQFVTGIRS